MRKTSASSAATVDRLGYTVNDACAAIGVKRTTLYGLLKRGEMKAVKVAGRTIIPRAELERIISVGCDEAA